MTKHTLRSIKSGVELFISVSLIILIVAGCASQQEMRAKQTLDRASSAYVQARANPKVAANAPAPLTEAGGLLEEAKQARSYREMERLGYLSEKKSQMAVAISEGKEFEKERQALKREETDLFNQKRVLEATVQAQSAKGELILTAFEPVGDMWRVAELGQFNNLVIETNFRTGAKCAGKDSYGMIVRAPSQADSVIDSAYVFGFNCDGQFRVYRMDNGSYNGIQNWSLHPSLRPGPNQKNVMTVSAQGDRLRLFANGTLVYEFTDAAYSRGLIGLMIGSGGTQNFQVAVEQLAYWELP